MKIDLILADANDFELFRATHHTAYRQVIETMFGWDDAVQDTYAAKDFEKNQPHKIMCNGKFAGFFSQRFHPTHIWLASIFLLPEFQNRGIGSKLIQNSIDEAVACGLPLRLQTLRMNTAKLLYERLGFRVSASNDTHWFMEYAVGGQ